MIQKAKIMNLQESNKEGTTQRMRTCSLTSHLTMKVKRYENDYMYEKKVVSVLQLVRIDVLVGAARH